MLGKPIAIFFSTARDAVARGMLHLHVTPNKLTFAGMILTLGVGTCYAIGAGKPFAWSVDPHAVSGSYLLLAAALLILASACDMLDGAVARIGDLSTQFGAFLDSTLDRYSDFVIYAGIALYYASRPEPNVTAIALAMMAFFNGFMISYSRARAEDIIEKCSVGYWQRGERSAAVLIATFAHNIPALVVQQAILPLFTVIRRMTHTHLVLSGKTPIEDVRQGGPWMKIRLWRYPRMSWAYDVVTGANILWLIFVRFEIPDVLGDLLRGGV
jgi:CDP-diacylglycerol--glycerol-3-phosphate 3-phosphatidyltransferase